MIFESNIIFQLPKPLFLVALLSLLVLTKPTYSQQSQTIDAIVATVANDPITFSDVTKRIKLSGGNTASSLEAAAQDPAFRATLEQLVLEKLILAEAKSRRLSVINEEIDAYISEIASKNNLSKDGFEAALKEQTGKSIDLYREETKIEILKSKIAANIVQNTIGVSDEEVDVFIKNNPELRKSGSKVKIRQITITTDKRSPEEAEQIAKAIKAKLDEGEDFEDLAQEYSDAPGAEDGGLLGVFAEEDLSSDFFEALLAIAEGQSTDIIIKDDGYHILFLEERYVDKDEDQEKLKTEVRELIKRQKLQTKLATFFTTELNKKYYVDRKI